MHVDTLARAGVQKIQAGIETLDTGPLKLMRKESITLQDLQTLMLAAGVERSGCLLQESGQVLALPLRQPGFRAAPSIAGVREAIGQPLTVVAA